jgi:hypothetical protein
MQNFVHNSLTGNFMALANKKNCSNGNGLNHILEDDLHGEGVRKGAFTLPFIA